MEQNLKALSWREPYASLMLYGKVETRTWRTHYRGLVLICASQKDFTIREHFQISGDQINRASKILGGVEWESRRGTAFAIGELVDCRPMSKADEDTCFVKFNADLWCHIYKNVKPIEPFEWKGSQGWKLIPEPLKSNLINTYKTLE